MKRHHALRRLARDHHQALVLAKAARRATEFDSAALAARVNAYFAASLEPHFEIEERLLLPALEAAGATEAVARTRAEHAALRAALGTLDARAPAALRRFGELLEAHVRFEDRALFGLAEALLAPEALAAINEASGVP